MELVMILVGSVIALTGVVRWILGRRGEPNAVKPPQVPVATPLEIVNEQAKEDDSRLQEVLDANNKTSGMLGAPTDADVGDMLERLRSKLK